MSAEERRKNQKTEDTSQLQKKIMGMSNVLFIHEVRGPQVTGSLIRRCTRYDTVR